MTATDLTPRHRDILTAVIVHYVLGGVPVGSGTLARKHPEKLSSATIRNTMAELEELGFLSQPHTSAGRIPTDRGYRVYVDSLMSGRPLSRDDERRIWEARPEEGETPEVDELLGRTMHLLSGLSSQVGVILRPRFSQAIMRHLEFLSLPGKKVLAIFLSQSGILDHKVIDSETKLTADDLEKINNLVSEEFHGKTLPDIRARLIEMMAAEKAQYDRLLAGAMELSRAYLDQRAQEAEDLLMEGASNVVEGPEFADADTMKELFRAFENQSRLVGLLNACLEENRTQILIGSECAHPDFRDLTLITSPYRYREKAVGALGIIGPRRMEYDRLVTVVDALSQFLSDSLARRARAGDLEYDS